MAVGNESRIQPDRGQPHPAKTYALSERREMMEKSNEWIKFKKWWKGFAKSGVNVPDRIVDRFELAEVISEKIKEIDSDLERKRK